MLRRVATIVTAFRATGLRGVTSAITSASTTIAGASRIINRFATGPATAGITRLVNVFNRLAAAAAKAGKSAAKMGLDLAGKATATAGALGAGKAGALAAFVGKSAKDTAEDLMPLRRMASLLNLPVETADAFRIYAERFGLAMDDLNPILSGFAAAVASARDPSSDLGKTFAALGVQLKDSKGRARGMLDIMLSLAKATSRLDAQSRNAVLNPIFGDDDTLKASEFLQKMARDGAKGIALDAKDFNDRGLIATEGDLEMNRELQASWQGLLRTYKVLKRELTNVFTPAIVFYFDKLSEFLTPDVRSDIIDRIFVQPFNRLMDVLHDVLKVFFNVEGATLKIGRAWTQMNQGWKAAPIIYKAWFTAFENRQDLKFPWLVELRDGLKTVYGIAKGVVALLGKLAQAAGSAVLALNEASRDGGGQTVWDRFKTLDTGKIADGFRRAGEYVKAFVSDLRTMAGAGGFDPSKLQTGLAKALVAVGMKIKETAGAIVEPIVRRFDALYARIVPVFDRIRAYVVGAWNEATMAMASGEGLKAVDTSLGQTIYLAGLFVRFLVGVVRAMEAIARGQPVDPAFAWVQSVYNGLVYLVEVLKQLASALSPIFGFLDKLSNLLFGVHFVVLLVVGRALMPLIRILGGLYGALVKVAQWVGGTLFAQAFNIGFGAARTAGAGFFASFAAGLQGILVASGAFASAFVTVFAPIIATLTLIIGLIAAAVAGWKIWQMRKENQKNEAIVDDMKRRDAFNLDQALKRQGGSMGAFNPDQVAYMQSPQFQTDLANTPAPLAADGTSKTPVKLFFNAEEIGELSGTDDQIDRLSRSADQAIGGYS